MRKSPRASLRSVLKNCIFGMLVFFYPRLMARASILMYHSVGTSGAFFAVDPQEFERQLAYLIAKKYTLVRFSELVARLERKETLDNVVCLTFDDGYADNYETVFPLLKKYQVSISLFLTTGRIGGTFTNSENITLPILSSEQIREMQESGLVEFLPHGEQHRKLSSLTREEVIQEVGASQRTIQTVLKSDPSLFAYPSGKYTTETMQILTELGIRAAVTVQPGLVRTFEYPYELPRNAIDSHTSFVQFRGKVSRAVEVFQSLR